MEPLQWNTLDEAAQWLTEITGERWSAKHVLSAALTHLKHVHPRPETYLKAAMPRDTLFGLYELDTVKGTPSNPFVRKFSSGWRTVPLHAKNVVDLLVHGETSVSLALSPDADEGVVNEYIFIEPLDMHCGHKISISIAGITAKDLKELLEKIMRVQRLSTDTKSGASHTTKALELLNQAINEFWESHDPKAPPKKDTVVKWFTDRGISKGVAESLDTTMRTDDAKKGGNKRVAPVNASK